MLRKRRHRATMQRRRRAYCTLCFLCAAIVFTFSASVRLFRWTLQTEKTKLRKIPTITRQQDGTLSQPPDAIVVGTGLAGLSAALTILDRGGRVILMEKEHVVGGNSNKASSGINGCCLKSDAPYTNDTLASFREDTVRSAGTSVRFDLIDTLVTKSAEAVNWLSDRVGVDLSLLAQLGGHTHKRTHRPRDGMVGAEIIYGMHQAVKRFEIMGTATIMVDTKVTRLLIDEDDGSVVGVEYEHITSTSDGSKALIAPYVILATGGFASDRSPRSLLAQFRPELLHMPATAGAFSTGDGVALATSLGASTVDMDKVQIHPTGWVDPESPDAMNKVLAAEVLRGVGGILINQDGKRFCNELGTRDYITDAMLAEAKTWQKEVPTFSLVLTLAAAEEAKRHVDLYSRKGLITKLNGIGSLAEWMNVPQEALVTTFRRYRRAAKAGRDTFGKTSFAGVPEKDVENQVFYAGTVTPVLHYCMGGITIDTMGHVLDEQGDWIQGLYAAGEVTGGVHGNNRLGGNSLLECAVFGTIVGQQIPLEEPTLPDIRPWAQGKPPTSDLRTISQEELQEHSTVDDCWVAIRGMVYDLTSFADTHPGGAKYIHNLAGKDGTAAFSAVHSLRMLDGFDHERIGRLETTSNVEAKVEVETNHQVTHAELMLHNKESDCWVALFGQVYDLTTFAKTHAGGAKRIFRLAGKDGSDAFTMFHPESYLQSIAGYLVGPLIED